MKPLNKFKNFLFLFIGLLGVSSFKSDDPIALVDEAIGFKPNSYYIANVTDDRADKSAIAQLIIKSPTNQTISQSLNLQGGVRSSVSQFIDRNLPKDKSLRPVNVSIKQFKLTESAQPDGSIEGRIKLQLSFGFEKDYGTEHLIDYEGGLRYIRTGNNTTAIEPRIRSVLKAGLVYFNDWVKTNAGVSRKLAKAVKFSFTNYTEQNEGDTIYYSANRPLTWADFQSRSKPIMNANAAVMPGFGYTLEQKVVNGIIDVKIALKVYLPKSASWADSYGRDAYSLNHEQRHFDITKVIAEQFRKKILDENLTPDNYEAFISMQYFDSYRDMNTIQKAYDKETGHSRNPFLQQEWDARIDKELNSFKTIN